MGSYERMKRPAVRAKEVGAGYDVATELYSRELAPGSMSLSLLESWSELLPTAGRVLDVGCGAGRATRWLDSHEYGVVSIDVSLKMLRSTREGRPEGLVVLADMRTLPFTTASFDGIAAFFAITHIPKAQIPLVLSEFRRVLNRHAHIIVSVGRGTRDETAVASWAGGHAMHFSTFEDVELRHFMTAAGFRILRTATCEAVGEQEQHTHLFLTATTTES